MIQESGPHGAFETLRCEANPKWEAFRQSKSLARSAFLMTYLHDADNAIRLVFHCLRSAFARVVLLFMFTICAMFR